MTLTHDSEVVCLDAEGKSVFLDLMRRKREAAILYCFDLLWLDGEDLRTLTWPDRKRRLQHLIRGDDSLVFADHVESRGIDFFETICSRDLEGIVAKHSRGTYRKRLRLGKEVRPNDDGKRRTDSSVIHPFPDWHLYPLVGSPHLKYLCEL